MISPHSDPTENQIDWEWHFNPRVAVPNADQIMAERQKMSARIRESRPFVADLRYGTASRSTLDVFPASSGIATLVFIHGGYWRAGSASDNSAIAEQFSDAGVAVFLLNYTLCPDTTVPEIVSQLTQALAWIKANGGNYGADPEQLYLCGVSAGAHLAAMLLASDPDIAGACLISGIYDLAPVLKVSVNAEIRLTREMVYPMSPMFHLPMGNPRLVMAVGDQEPSLWIQQTRDYHDRCTARGLSADLLEVEGANHFSVAQALYDKEAPIAHAMKSAMGVQDDLAASEADE